MEKRMDYPIKYAVLELKEKGGWLVGYQDITQGFIVSKCYVMGSNIIYNADGSFKISHKVVFPYDNIELFKSSAKNNIGDRIYPRFDACGKPYPVRIVEELFFTYEDAKDRAIEKNEKFKRGLSLNISVLDATWKDKHDYLQKKYDEQLAVCNCFETRIMEETMDMEIGKNNNKEIIRILKL